MDSSVSLNGVCITATSNQKPDSANIIPHYLRPSTGSCHDICKYGRRREFEEQPTKTLHKTTAVVPCYRKKEFSNYEPSADNAQKRSLSMKPSSDAKSFSPRSKNRSLRQNTSSYTPRVVKRGIALSEKARVQLNESTSIGSKMSRKTCYQSMKLSAFVRMKPEIIKPSLPCDSSDGFLGKRKRKTWIPVGAPLSSNTITSEGRKTTRMELSSTQKRVRMQTQFSEMHMGTQNIAFQGENDRKKIPRTEFEFEAVADTSSSSSHGEGDEESDKLVSDTTRNHNKRRRKSRSGDKHSRPVKLKFRTGNSTCLHEETNVPRRHIFRRARVDGMRAHDKNKFVRNGSPKNSRTKDKYRSSKNRCRRVRYGKTRILVLEDRKGDSKRDFQENDSAGIELLLRKNNLNHQDLPRKKDVQCLFNNVIEETASKLAETRKGMVKSLVGAFETLISLQACKCRDFLVRGIPVRS